MDYYFNFILYPSILSDAISWPSDALSVEVCVGHL